MTIRELLARYPSKTRWSIDYGVCILHYTRDELIRECPNELVKSWKLSPLETDKIWVNMEY